MFGTFAKILKQGFFLAQYHQSLIFLKGNMNNFFAAKMTLYLKLFLYRTLPKNSHSFDFCLQILQGFSNISLFRGLLDVNELA